MAQAVCQFENQNVPLSMEKCFQCKASQPVLIKRWEKISDPTRNVVYPSVLDLFFF